MADFRIIVNYDRLTIGVAGQKVTVLKVGPQGVKGDKGDKGDQGASDWADITNKPATFTPPVASNSTLGGIIVGSNLSITNNGVLSANIPPGGVETFNGRTGNVTLTANDVTTVANGIYQANGSYLNDVLTNLVTSYSSSEVVSGLRKSTGSANFVSGGLTLPGVGIVGVVAGNETSGIEFRTGGIFATMRLRQFAHTLTIRNSGFEVETGTANWSWSANSILTQGRGNSLYIADTTAVLVPVSYGNDLFYGHYQTKNRAGAFPYVSGGLMLGSNAMVGIANQSDPCNIEFWPGDIFNVMRFRSYNKSIVINNDGFSVETGTANWFWSANTILTQGRGDARYQPVGSYLTSANLTWSNITGKPTFATVATSGSYIDLANTPNLSLYLTTANAATTYLPIANFTYSNITGKPTLANVATSGNYNDLSNKPASYTLPAATNSTLGGIIVGANLSVSANGTLSANIPAGGGGGFANGDILNGGTF